jgi:pyrimidine-nucleoside phosphorylase
VIPGQTIASKRDGSSLSADEIDRFIRGYVAGEIPDYQMAALAMAIYLRGMNDAEIGALTHSMLHSGRVLSAEDRTDRVDKHSTGGLGDKSSLIVAPLLACCGLKVPMISGRGLGFTGGTLDKLESIPGFRTNLPLSKVQEIVEQVGCVITSATSDLVPADRKLYALRDVTATVDSIPLITASIMSKKLAEGLSALVLDVKFGSGAFMKSKHDAERLARSLVAVGKHMGVRTAALLTDMNQPNGRMVGNGVEVDEAIEVLSGRGPADVRDLSVALASEVLTMVNRAADREAARNLLAEHLDAGRALAKFREMVTAQGGDIEVRRTRAPSSVVTAKAGGFVTSMNVENLGLAIIEMGGGRKKKTDAIDRSVGLEMLVRLGDSVERGQPLVRIFFGPEKCDIACRIVEQAIEIGPNQPEVMPLIAGRVTD